MRFVLGIDELLLVCEFEMAVEVSLEYCEAVPESCLSWESISESAFESELNGLAVDTPNSVPKMKSKLNKLLSIMMLGYYLWVCR